MQTALLRMASPCVTPTILNVRLSTRTNLPSGSAPLNSTSDVASSMSADALSEALREALAPWEKVRRIVVVDELPTTATGKPDPLGAAELFSASER